MPCTIDIISLTAFSFKFFSKSQKSKYIVLVSLARSCGFGLHLDWDVLIMIMFQKDHIKSVNNIVWGVNSRNEWIDYLILSSFILYLYPEVAARHTRDKMKLRRALTPRQ